MACSQSLQKDSSSSKQLATFLVMLTWKYSQKCRQYSATSKSGSLSGCRSYLTVRKWVNSLPKQYGSFWYSWLVALKETQSPMLKSFPCWASAWQQATKQAASRSMKLSSCDELIPEARLNSAFRYSHSALSLIAYLQAFPTRRSWPTSSAVQKASEKAKSSGCFKPFWMLRRQRNSPMACCELLKISMKSGEAQMAVCTTTSKLVCTPLSPAAMPKVNCSCNLPMAQKLANCMDSSKGAALWVIFLPLATSKCVSLKYPLWQILTPWKHPSCSQTKNSLRNQTVSYCIKIQMGDNLHTISIM